MSDPRAREVIGGYAAIARGYREQLGDELVGKPLDRAFLDAFVERVNGLIVDVGCGPGHIASYLATRGATVEGVDLSPEMIAEATATHPNLKFRVADMFALPYANAAVGGIVAFYAIVHLNTGELVTPFREYHRVLAPGGLCTIAFHAGTETIHVDEMFGAATSLDFRFHPPDAVIEALTAAGFTIEARLDRAPYPNAEHPSQRTYLLARR
jgi:SAM-dependent methyltransferase